MADRDPVTEQGCPTCGAILAYRGRLDGGLGGGSRFNVLLWGCGDCGPRLSATTDLTNPDALSRIVPEPWPADDYWPG